MEKWNHLEYFTDEIMHTKNCVVWKGGSMKWNIRSQQTIGTSKLPTKILVSLKIFYKWGGLIHSLTTVYVFISFGHIRIPKTTKWVCLYGVIQFRSQDLSWFRVWNLHCVYVITTLSRNSEIIIKTHKSQTQWEIHRKHQIKNILTFVRFIIIIA